MIWNQNPRKWAAGSRGPFLSWVCTPVGLVTGTKPTPGPFDESEEEGPRGAEVWALGLKAQAAAGHGVRWSRTETQKRVLSK